jgi:hypothetical protein
MKKIIIAAFLLIAAASHAQVIIGTAEGRSRPQKFMLPNTVSAIDRNSRTANALPASSEVKIIGTQGDNYIVKVKSLPPGQTGQAPANTYIRDTSGQPVTFLVDKTTLNQERVATGPSVVPYAGALSFPFKYRDQDGVVETSFSLSGVVGAKAILRNADEDKMSLSLLVGLGASSIKLDEKNTDPEAGIKEETSRAAATLSATFLFEWQKIQIAISTGMDKNLNNKKDLWKYQSKPWVSMGIGFNVFSGAD